MRCSSTSVCRRARDRHVLIAASVLAVLLIVGVFTASCGGTTSATTSSTPTTVATSSTTSAPGTTEGGAGGAQVVMKNTAFDPATVTIKVGESVTWTNDESLDHTVVADNGEFQSDNMGQGSTFTFKFETAGTYPYHCSIHPSMTGTVVVE